MKDKIKITFPEKILDYVDTKEHLLELFNYITNLQQENEKLKEELQQRIDKAVEYIEENDFTNDMNFMETGIGNLFQVILNFLKGDSNE